MRKKDMLARAVEVLLPSDLFFGCKYFLWNGLIVLAYHRVINVQDVNSYEYDMDLVSATIEQFEHQMFYISKHMHPVGEKDIVSYLYQGKKLPKRAIMVTFDDGFDDNYLNAFPILIRHSIPATMFISTYYIGGNEPIWFDWLASLFMSATVNVINVPDLGIEYIRGGRTNNRNSFLDLIIKLRAVSNEERLSTLQYLKNEYKQYMSHINTNKSRFMNWDQVNEMSQSIIYIGSHTVTHPILSRLDDDEISVELADSKRIIEDRINSQVNSISYPTGMESSFTDKVIDMVRTCGYKLGFTYQHGFISMPIKDPYRMKRVHVENHINAAYFNSMMKFPMVFRD